jgi:hypothetical protein
VFSHFIDQVLFIVVLTWITLYPFSLFNTRNAETSLLTAGFLSCHHQFMKRLRIMLPAILLIAGFSKVCAQTPPSGSGCLLNGRVYYQNVQPSTTSGLNYRFRYNPAFYYELTCDGTRYATLGAIVRTPILNSVINCGTSANYNDNTGTTYFINVVNCTIDKGCMILVLICSFTGFVFIRSKGSVL